MLCSNCNKTIPEDSVFCPYCGKQLKTVTAKQNNTRKLYGVIGLLATIIVVLAVQLYKATKNNNEQSEITKETSVAEIEEISHDSRVGLSESGKGSYPNANPKSLDNLDPLGYINNGQLFKSNDDSIINNDNFVVGYEDDDTIVYTTCPGINYFGIDKELVSVSLYDDKSDSQGITIVEYLFGLESQKVKDIMRLLVDIRAEIEKNYGKLYDMVAFKKDEDSDFEEIDISEFNNNIYDKVAGDYEFYWFFNDYSVVLGISYNPNDTVSIGYVSFDKMN